MKATKYYANRGVARNKKPLQNILYRVTIISKLRDGISQDLIDDYTVKYGIAGKWLDITWGYEKTPLYFKDYTITTDILKSRVSIKAWSKFINKINAGATEYTFVIQRRVNNKNI